VTVLITGAAGFLGRHLAASLLADGQHVVGVDNFITSDRADLTRLLTTPGFDFIEIDISDPRFTARVEEYPITAIYNLACPTGVDNLGPLGEEMLVTSYEGSKAVLELARRKGASALLTSTAEVYGNPEVSPQTETYTGNVDTLGPRKGYEEGKRVAETLFGLYAEKYGVAAKIVRVFNTYGPGMCISDTRVVPSFIRLALRGEPLQVYGEGLQTRCHTFADDMVRGLRLAMAKGVPGRAYNLGSDKQVTVIELARLLVELLDTGATIRHKERPGHDHDHRLPDTTRARTELGWTPVKPLREGLLETIADFRVRMGVNEATAVQKSA
jgi:nucleoside-diphosphate-sugar epimerase